MFLILLFFFLSESLILFLISLKLLLYNVPIELYILSKFELLITVSVSLIVSNGLSLLSKVLSLFLINSTNIDFFKLIIFFPLVLFIFFLSLYHNCLYHIHLYEMNLYYMYFHAL